MEQVEWKLEWPNRAWVGRFRFRKNVDDRVQTLRHSRETPVSLISTSCMTRTARNWLCFRIATPPTESKDATQLSVSMADQEPPLVNLLSTEAKAKSVEGHNTIKEVSRRIQDDGYRGGHGRRNVALVGD